MTTSTEATVVMLRELFLDTSYAIALSAPGDALHDRAIHLADRIQDLGIRLATTRAVLLEIGNALARQRHRAAAIRLLDGLHSDTSVAIVEVPSDLYDLGFRLFRSRHDKEWGRIDCVSFVVMQQRGLTAALTADEHFQQCGFRALLQEDDPDLS